MIAKTTTVTRTTVTTTSASEWSPPEGFATRIETAFESASDIQHVVSFAAVWARAGYGTDILVDPDSGVILRRGPKFHTQETIGD
jgi:hypothetical protein